MLKAKADVRIDFSIDEGASGTGGSRFVSTKKSKVRTYKRTDNIYQDCIHQDISCKPLLKPKLRNDTRPVSALTLILSLFLFHLTFSFPFLIPLRIYRPLPLYLPLPPPFLSCPSLFSLSTTSTPWLHPRTTRPCTYSCKIAVRPLSPYSAVPLLAIISQETGFGQPIENPPESALYLWKTCWWGEKLWVISTIISHISFRTSISLHMSHIVFELSVLYP